MKRLLSCLFIVVIILTLCVDVIAHSGKTDAEGGHYDHSTGEYHYHCNGNPAHKHKNGVCPYDKKGTTSSSSSCVSDIENTVCIVIIIGMIAFMVYAMFSKK